MATKTTSSTLFKPELTQELFNKVRGHSTLAKLCGSTPIPFAGTETFVFTMDGEVSLVGEGGNKPAGEADFKPVIIQPYKFIYQHRITDEFVHLSEEKQLPYLSAFSDGFAKKIARGFDITAIHGLNPATKTASQTVGNNCFNKAVTNIIKYNPTYPDNNIDDAVEPIQKADGIVTGIAMSPEFGAVLGKMKTADSNISIYPEYRFGNNPGNFCGMNADINNTISFNSSDIRAVVGDFANCFRWGYADNIPLEIIEYGNPDGQGDLKQSNEIVLRSEAYIGWGILDKSAFSLIKVIAEEEEEEE